MKGISNRRLCGPDRLWFLGFVVALGCSENQDRKAEDAEVAPVVDAAIECDECEVAAPSLEEQTNRLVCPERSVVLYWSEDQVVRDLVQREVFQLEYVLESRNGSCLENLGLSGLYEQPQGDGGIGLAVDLWGHVANIGASFSVGVSLVAPSPVQGLSAPMFGLESDDIRVEQDDVHGQWSFYIRSRLNSNSPNGRDFFEPELQFCISRRTGCPMEFDGWEEDLY